MLPPPSFVTERGANTASCWVMLHPRYLRDLVAPVTTPVKMLKGFERVFLLAGASASVTFHVDVQSELKVLGRNYEWMPPAGSFKAMIGGSADTATDMGTFEIA